MQQKEAKRPKSPEREDEQLAERHGSGCEDGEKEERDAIIFIWQTWLARQSMDRVFIYGSEEKREGESGLRRTRIQYSPSGLKTTTGRH